MMNNSFIANCPQNEDKAIENLLNAFIDNLDKKSKEQYRQVRNILEKKNRIQYRCREEFSAFACQTYCKRPHR